LVALDVEPAGLFIGVVGTGMGFEPPVGLGQDFNVNLVVVVSGVLVGDIPNTPFNVVGLKERSGILYEHVEAVMGIPLVAEHELLHLGELTKPLEPLKDGLLSEALVLGIEELGRYLLAPEPFKDPLFG